MYKWKANKCHLNGTQNSYRMTLTIWGQLNMHNVN